MTNYDPFLSKIAYLYYKENMTQQEIADEMGIHRASISRYLNIARENEIVTFNIKGIEDECFKLEQFVKSRYNLKSANIVHNSTNTEDNNDLIAERAAMVLKQRIKKKMTVGVSWGETISNSINCIDGNLNTDADFVPIVGGPSQINSKYHVNTIVYELARVFGGKSYFIDAAAIQDNSQIATAIKNSSYLKDIIKAWGHLDIAIVGVGGIIDQNSESKWRYMLNDNDYDSLKLFEAVGDCCCRFFNEDGRVIKDDLYNRTIAIELETLKNVPDVIAIANGQTKTKAVLALLKKRYIDHLITDKTTILNILNLDGVKFNDTQKV